MSVVGLLGANVLMLLTGVGVLSGLGLTTTLDELRRRIGSAYLAGISATGIVSATLVVAHVPVSPIVLGAETVVSLGLGASRFRPRREHRTDRVLRDPFDRALSRSLAASLVLFGIAMTVAASSTPLIKYDGWAIWGMKAHALSAFGWARPEIFASHAYSYSHTDYPLLAPTIESLGIQAAGGFDSRLVVLQCVLIGFAGVVAAWSMLADCARPRLLWPTLAAICVAPSLFRQLESGYADMPLAFFVAAGLLASARWLLDHDRSWLALATLFFSAAVLTKNEGLLFVAASYVGLCAVSRGGRRELLLSAAVISAVLAPWRAYTSIHHLRSTDFRLSRSLDPDWIAHHSGRGVEALWSLISYALSPGRFGLLVPLGLLAAAAAFSGGNRRIGVLSLSFATVSLLGLAWIYLISWIPLREYLNQSGDRVVASIVVGIAALAPLAADTTVTTSETVT